MKRYLIDITSMDDEEALEKWLRAHNFMFVVQDNEEQGRDPELDQIPPEPEDRSKFPHCPLCWTNGHEHRKSCPYAGHGMAYHVRPPSTEHKE